MSTPFLIATRKSKMALAQANHVADLLREAVPGLEVDLAENAPRGDRDQISRLDRHGGKGGAFVAEIRADVVAGRSQCAMHSLKDMPGNEEVPGLVIAAYLKRDDPTDSLVLRPGLTMEDLERRWRAGFSRRHQLRAPRRVSSRPAAEYRDHSFSRRCRQPHPQTR